MRQEVLGSTYFTQSVVLIECGTVAVSIWATDVTLSLILSFHFWMHWFLCGSYFTLVFLVITSFVIFLNIIALWLGNWPLLLYFRIKILLGYSWASYLLFFSLFLWLNLPIFRLKLLRLLADSSSHSTLCGCYVLLGLFAFIYLATEFTFSSTIAHVAGVLLAWVLGFWFSWFVSYLGFLTSLFVSTLLLISTFEFMLGIFHPHFIFKLANDNSLFLFPFP